MSPRNRCDQYVPALDLSRLDFRGDGSSLLHAVDRTQEAIAHKFIVIFGRLGDQARNS